MAILTILEYPDRRLHKVARPVTAFDDRLHKLLADMTETMYAANGVGLAATQVDVHERVVLLDLSETRSDLRVFVNPTLTWTSSETAEGEEGCLSVPGVFDKVTRPAKVRVRAQDAHGNEFELECEDRLAVAIQHEIDHLDGKVFVEKLSLLKQARARAKLRKRQMEQQRERQRGTRREPASL
ncbi:peptide deformylase [Burkholderiales bacterium GJ-E10]|nr:peptide deformylase [Burkholderiales bacterium GJ-E10]